jgi:two-component system LytT family sensor kinase
VKNTAPLIGGVLVIWLLVWLGTQTVPSTPLQTAPTVLTGVALTVALLGSYPSLIRVPRRRGGLSAATLDSSSGDPLDLVNRTLPAFREGLTEDTAARLAKQLLPLTGGKGVEITDTGRVLGTAGVGTDGELSEAGRTAMKAGHSVRRRSDDEMVLAIPLRLDERIIGSITARFGADDTPPVERIDAVANLISLHIEIAELTEKAQLAADAKLDALRAQINPHFLFNTLNTIASKSRTDPDEARQLLQRLADFFRYATQQEGHFAEFAHEYFFVRTYLSLEQARFDDRLNIHYDIDPQVLATRVPVLIIQPLVENAVKHGIAPKPGGGTLGLRARVDPLAGSIRIGVRDDGVGMDSGTLTEVATGSYDSPDGHGVGLRNIHERLERLYGTRYQFDIRSSPGKGTRITLELPL